MMMIVMRTQQARHIIVGAIASVLALAGCVSDPNNLNKRLEIAPPDGVVSPYSPTPKSTD